MDGLRADLPFGGDEVATQLAPVSQTRLDVDNPRELTFRLRYNLPRRADLYTLALLNCKATEVKVEGEATFTGADGEKLSIPQVCRGVRQV